MKLFMPVLCKMSIPQNSVESHSHVLRLLQYTVSYCNTTATVYKPIWSFIIKKMLKGMYVEISFVIGLKILE